MKRSITYEPEYEGYPIMTNEKKQLGCDKKILKIIKDQFAQANETNSKTFFLRYDIRFPEGSNDYNHNRVVSSFQANYTKNLRRQGLNPQYVLVREKATKDYPHYHGILLLDGQKTQSIHNHIDTAERLWRSALGMTTGNGLIHSCDKDSNGKSQTNGVMLRKDDPEYEVKKANCFHRSSYLAKINHKSSTPKGEREVFSSQLKVKNN